MRNIRKTINTASPFNASSMIGAAMDVVLKSAALTEPVSEYTPMPTAVFKMYAPPPAITTPQMNAAPSRSFGSFS